MVFSCRRCSAGTHFLFPRLDLLALSFSSPEMGTTVLLQMDNGTTLGASQVVTSPMGAGAEEIARKLLLLLGCLVGAFGGLAFLGCQVGISIYACLGLQGSEGRQSN